MLRHGSSLSTVRERRIESVSYTHLDVYKRQSLEGERLHPRKEHYDRRLWDNLSQSGKEGEQFSLLAFYRCRK